MALDNQNPPVRDPRQDPAFDPLAESRRLLRTVRVATLATLTEDGAPFATLTVVATDVDGTPILLISNLAVHTRNLARDGRCSLLLAQGGRGDPMAHPRLTLMTTAEKTLDPRARARFLRRNPKAALYADFPDFSFWRAEVGGVHLNGGFARAADFGGKWLLLDTTGAEGLIQAEAELVADLNANATRQLALCAEKLGGVKAGSWQASGVDPEGIDLIEGDSTARLVFPRLVASPQEAREAFAELSRLAGAA